MCTRVCMHVRACGSESREAAPAPSGGLKMFIGKARGQYSSTSMSEANERRRSGGTVWYCSFPIDGTGDVQLHVGPGAGDARDSEGHAAAQDDPAPHHLPRGRGLAQLHGQRVRSPRVDRFPPVRPRACPATLPPLCHLTPHASSFSGFCQALASFFVLYCTRKYQKCLNLSDKMLRYNYY